MVFYDIILLITGMYIAQEFLIPNVKENVLIILKTIQQTMALTYQN